MSLPWLCVPGTIRISFGSFSAVIFGFFLEVLGLAGVLRVFCAGFFVGTAHCWPAERLMFWGFELGDSYFESGFGFLVWDLVGIGWFFGLLS